MHKTPHDTPSSICCCDECRTLRAQYNNDAGEPPSPRKPDLPRYSTRNASRADHIARLRLRTANAVTVNALRGVIAGILDLLEDDGS